MSVIVEAPNGEMLLFCKGADNVIYERLDQGKAVHGHIGHHTDWPTLDTATDGGIRE